MGRFILGAVAILNILAAVVFVGCGACANVSDSPGEWKVEVNGKRVADEKMLREHLAKEVPGYPAVKIAGFVLGYGICVGLILSGIALFFGRWWGKLVAAPIYALAIIHHAAMIIYYLVWLHPAIAKFFTQIPRPGLIGPAIVGDAIDVMITTQSWVARWPGYVAITWWIVGILYYLAATPAVLLAPTSSGDADEKTPPIEKSRRGDENEENEDEDDDNEPPARKVKGRSSR